MNKNWSKTTLGSLGKISMCKRILKEETSESGDIPFYKISTFGGIADAFISKDIFEKYRETYSYPKIGDILISAAGTLGKTVIFDGKPSYFQDSNIVWVDNDEKTVINSFLYYFYQTNPWIKTTGSTINRLYNNDIKNLEISFPNLIKQQSIAAVLSALDKKIALNKQINARLEQMAKTLYDYWFVQFDFPDVDGKPYKSSGGDMVFDETLKREIPKGWEVVTLKDFLTIKNGKDHKPLSDGKYTVYGSGGAIRCVDDYLFEGESVLIPRKGTLNNVMYIDEAFWTVDTMFYTEMKQDFFAKYVFYSIKDIDFTKFNLGTGVPSMTSSILYSLKIIKPSNCSLKHFEDVVKPIFLKIANNEKQNHQLTQLRDFLLPMLMNGQVSVTCSGARDG